MTQEELIVRIERDNDIKVIANPFIKLFVHLTLEEKKKVASKLIEKEISIIRENGAVNNLGLLLCLWPQLSFLQKKEHITDIQNAFKSSKSKLLKTS